MLVRRREFLYWQFPAWLWGMTILVLTSIPSLKLPPLGVQWEDKIYHLLVYALLGLLLARAFIRGREGRCRIGIIQMLTFGALLAFLDELHQALIPGRFCDFWDAIADLAGLALAALIYHLSARALITKDCSIYCILYNCNPSDQ